jgi:hypothetical protein
LLIRQEYSAPPIEAPDFVFNKKCVVRWKDSQNLFEGHNCYPSDSWSLTRDVFWLRRNVNVMGALQLLTREGWDLILKVGYTREDNGTTTKSWGKEWISLEKIEAGTALQEHCESYRGVNSYPEKRLTVQQFVFTRTCHVQAMITSCEILEEDVFLVELSINEITTSTLGPC